MANLPYCEFMGVANFRNLNYSIANFLVHSVEQSAITDKFRIISGRHVCRRQNADNLSAG